MKITETKLKDCYSIDPDIFTDHRGVFFESFHKADLEEAMGTSIHFVQSNVSISKKGVLRGLHFQKGKFAQSKLVQVLKGEVLDVVVDVRRDSLTFGQHIKFKLSSENRKSIYIPRGMAHGFLALSEEVIFEYKCGAYYNRESESGILFNDPDLGIEWEFPLNKIILSEKDLKLPLFKDVEV